MRRPLKKQNGEWWKNVDRTQFEFRVQFHCVHQEQYKFATKSELERALKYHGISGEKAEYLRKFAQFE